MWEKLTERDNRNKYKFITYPQELYIFLPTPGIEVVNLLFANHSIVWATWRFTAEESMPTIHHTN